ncbi:MAG: UDP-3-O-(3-hydroxymyristoyl)glucosamine N-acyltransferase [Negativicutes bacterium]|jgi:UDP-3-O-[3-hydroxymyristoyl] glucosamine N-acyltransferase
MKKYRLSEIASMVHGELVSSVDYEITGVTNLIDATANDLSFAVPPHMEPALQSAAVALIVDRGTTDYPKPHIKVENPRMAFAMLLDFFYGYKKPAAHIHPRATISETAKIGNNVAIMANAVVDDGAEIGAGCVLYPGVYVGSNSKIGAGSILFANVVVYYGCIIGERCTLHAGVVVGADGFGFVTDKGVHHKVPQVGNVIIGDDVEIGANSTIDRAATGSTVIGAGTKLDNLLQIGHNVQMGKGCLAAALVGISGSTIIGDYCTFGGQVGSGGHQTIGDNCIFAARTGINTDVPANSFMAGHPMKPYKQWVRDMVAFRNIGDLAAKVKALGKAVAKISDGESE